MPEEVRPLRQNPNSVAISVCLAAIRHWTQIPHDKRLWEAKDEVVDEWSATLT